MPAAGVSVARSGLARVPERTKFRVSGRLRHGNKPLTHETVPSEKLARGYAELLLAKRASEQWSVATTSAVDLPNIGILAVWALWPRSRGLARQCRDRFRSSVLHACRRFVRSHRRSQKCAG
jgi:hypothetical protein